MASNFKTENSLENAHKRGIYIDDILTKAIGQKDFSTDEIYQKLSAKGIECSKKTLQDDLKKMREESDLYPIEYIAVGKAYKYRYTKPFSRRKDELTSDDIAKFKFAYSLLKQLEMPDIFKNVLDKINYTISNSECIHFDFNDNYVDQNSNYNIDKVPVLLNYIEDKQVLEIDYVPFGKDMRTHIFQPSFLKQYNQRWYLCGKSNLFHKGKFDILALDRIKAFRPTDTSFNAPSVPSDYFDDVIGVTVPYDQLKETIIFKVSAKRVQYVRTKPLHHSQRLLKDHDGHTFSLSLLINPELISMLLSFGSDLEVLAPEALRQTISDLAAAVLAQYSQKTLSQ